MKLTAFLTTAFFANTAAAAAYDQTCAAQCARFASTVEEYQTCLKGLCITDSVEDYQGSASKRDEFLAQYPSDKGFYCAHICAYSSSSTDDFNQCVKECLGDDATTESKAESFVSTAENIVPLPGSGIFECQRQCDADFGKFIGEKLDCYDRCRSSDADTSSGDEAFLKESFNDSHITCAFICAYISTSTDDYHQCIEDRCRSGSLAKTDTLTLKEMDTSTEFTSIPNCEEYCQNAYSFPHDIATCKRVVCSRGFEAASVKVASKKNLRGLSEDDTEVNAGNPVIKSSSFEEDTASQNPLFECFRGCSESDRVCIDSCLAKCREFGWHFFCF